MTPHGFLFATRLSGTQNLVSGEENSFSLARGNPFSVPTGKLWLDNFLPYGWAGEGNFHQPAAYLLKVSLRRREAGPEVPEGPRCRAQLPSLLGLSPPILLAIPSFRFSEREQRRALWRETWGPFVALLTILFSLEL